MAIDDVDPVLTIAELDEMFSVELTAIDDDPESRHIEADNKLCELLELMGFTRTVEAFRSLPKWYA